MRLQYATREEAQAKASAIHAWMIANDSAYANSVSAGQTTSWAKPYRDFDTLGVPISIFWYVNCKERCRAALSAADLLALVSYRAG